MKNILLILSILPSFAFSNDKIEPAFLTPTELSALSTHECEEYLTQIESVGHPMAKDLKNCLLHENIKNCRRAYLTFAQAGATQCEVKGCATELKVAKTYRTKINGVTK
jgi:hypothetical protein